MLIFVYGTLLKGLERNAVLAKSEFKGSGSIQASLFDCGSYPGIQEGEHIVYGEVYAIDEATLQFLDQIEGYQEGHQSSESLFVRREVSVNQTAGTVVTAFCYFYNHEVDELTLIGHGDYRRYRAEEK